MTETNGNGGETTTDTENSMIGPLWGQFVTHDIIQTPDMGAEGTVKCDCTNIAECKNIEVDKEWRLYNKSEKINVQGNLHLVYIS